MVKVSIYAVVDIRPSMRGSKIRQVCSSILDIIKNCPNDVLFDVTTFHSTTTKIVTALKSGFDAQAIVKEVESLCNNESGMTALYDAWGSVINEIPSSGKYSCFAKIFYKCWVI